MSETLELKNNHGSLFFDSLGNHDYIGSSHTIQSNTFFSLTAQKNIDIDTYTGNLNIISDIGVITINSDGNITNAIIIEATNSNGGILETAGTGGITLLTSNGDIDILSQGSNINIGVSPIGTPATQQTQDVTIESFNNFNVSAGGWDFVRYGRPRFELWCLYSGTFCINNSNNHNIFPETQIGAIDFTYKRASFLYQTRP